MSEHQKVPQAWVAILVLSASAPISDLVHFFGITEPVLSAGVIVIASFFFFAVHDSSLAFCVTQRLCAILACFAF